MYLRFVIRNTVPFSIRALFQILVFKREHSSVIYLTSSPRSKKPSSLRLEVGNGAPEGANHSNRIQRQRTKGNLVTKGMTKTGQKLKTNGIELYFETRGEGEPLLLLHGFTGACTDWGILGWEWTEGFQVITPDLRGHGRSSQIDAQFTHKQAALDIISLLDHLKIQKLKAVGTSCGGNLLLHLATMQPDRVQAMVIVSATTHYPEQARALMRQSSVENLTESDWKVLRDRHVGGDLQVHKLYEHSRGFASDFEDMSFTPDRLAKIKARTLIIQGDRDPFYPLQTALDLYQSIPNSSLWIVPNSGHCPISFDAVQTFTQPVRNFLTNYK